VAPYFSHLRDVTFSQLSPHRRRLPEYCSQLSLCPLEPRNQHGEHSHVSCLVHIAAILAQEGAGEGGSGSSGAAPGRGGRVSRPLIWQEDLLETRGRKAPWASKPTAEQLHGHEEEEEEGGGGAGAAAGDKEADKEEEQPVVEVSRTGYVRYRGIQRSPSPAYLEMIANIQPANVRASRPPLHPTPPTPRGEIPEIPEFEEADRNGDGVVDLAEFKREHR